MTGQCVRVTHLGKFRFARQKEFIKDGKFSFIYLAFLHKLEIVSLEEPPADLAISGTLKNMFSIRIYDR